jgi:hypothetical protein
MSNVNFSIDWHRPVLIGRGWRQNGVKRLLKILGFIPFNIEIHSPLSSFLLSLGSSAHVHILRPLGSGSGSPGSSSSSSSSSSSRTGANMKISVTAALALMEPSSTHTSYGSYHRSLLELAGHRGGISGHNSFVPEHSKAAYALGASYGATYLEPDVISTKDAVLMVCHGNELSRTSDIADKAEFADRKTTKIINDGDGSGVYTAVGWFSEDFTWEEISTLRLRATSHEGPLDGIYGFLKFEDMLDYVAGLEETLGWEIGGEEGCVCVCM